MQPKLTIGMAHHDDYDGVYFSIQALRLYHAQAMQHCEIVVVDNSPDTTAGQMVADFMRNKAAPGTAGAKYVKMQQPLGTSISREKIFAEASAPHVLVMDCHVLLMTGALDRLLAWYDKHPDSRDIYSGPIVLDPLNYFHTHFNDEWRGEMWGTWGNAWQCGCGAEGLRFSTANDGNGKLSYRLLSMGHAPVTMCGECEQRLPEVGFAGHEPHLIKAGYIRLGSDDSHEPFEIPGMGLGTFSASKASWPGFNRHARGFGGEEMYIHEKYRQAGGRAICLPWLRWVHRFGRANGVSYLLTNWNKMRNYVLEFQELGRDLAPVHEHFVERGKVNQDAWDYLLEDPIAHEEEPPNACGSCGEKSGGNALAKAGTLDEVFIMLQSMPRDLDQHMDKLAELAGQVEHVTEFSKRRESTVALASGGPQKLVSYQVEQDALIKRLPQLTGDTQLSMQPLDSPKVDSIEETDMLFIDSTQHTFRRMTEELTKYAPQVRRYIVCHDTRLHSEKGEDGGPGLLTAMRAYMRAHPEWSVIEHTDTQYGLTVLGRLPGDKPQLPSKIKMAANLATALTKHVASGGVTASEEVLEQRLEICSICPQRKDDRCTVCGCFVASKASLDTQECPLGKWPQEEGA